MLETVNISVPSMWQRFVGCDLDYIAAVCHGRCCDAPSRPGGSMVTIHRSERAAIEARGGVVGDDGMLVTTDGCTFKNAQTHLCDLHTTPDKPFGCIASPFTLTGMTLVIRNRYRRLPCYISKAEAGRAWYPPAFEAFRASLHLIFGTDEADRIDTICRRRGDPAEGGDGSPFLAYMTEHAYDVLVANDAAKKDLENVAQDA